VSASEVKQKMKKIIDDSKKTCPDIFSDNKIEVFLLIKYCPIALFVNLEKN